MSPHTIAARAAEASLLEKADPGDGNSISVGGRSQTYIGLVTAGAETRTLKDPSSPGQQLTMCCRTYVGDCVITASSQVNQAGNNTITFDAAGETLHLIAVKEGTSLEWRVMGNDGSVGLATV